MQLTCSNLHLTYPKSKSAVIDNLSFSMTDPGFNAVFGPSGVGKTTFARIISNGQAPFQGSLHDNIQGNINTTNIDRILYTYNLERLPGWSNIGKHLNKVASHETQALKDQLIQIFGLQDLLILRFSQLSMGQQNRINLIRYLLQDFDLLMMDESLANVDEKLREKIILAIKELFPDKMFIYISHHLMEVSKYCRQILVFGNPSTEKKYTLITGQDYKKGELINKQKLDATMLEIMNAF